LKNYLVFLIIIPLLHSCAFIVNKVSFFPNRTDIVKQLHLPSHVSLVRFGTLDKKTIEALYYKNDNNHKVILYFHGNTGNIYGRMPECQMLFSSGFNVFIVSYRGYSKSEGRPSEKGVYVDAESSLEFLRNHYNYKTEEVYVLGRSLGTAVAVNLCQKKDIKKLILVTPMSCGNDLANAMGVGFLKPFAGDPFDSYSKINNISSEILIIHGTADEVIPYSQGKKLFNHFTGTKTFVTVLMGHHNDLEITDSKQYWESISNFLNK
jgi:fermentation-respiration switch protein FrsA (DUF1100 family)